MTSRKIRTALLLCVGLLCLSQPATAQDPGTLDPAPLPPIADPDSPSVPAKELFGRKREPAAMTPHVIGFYSNGCLAGGAALPIDGDAWQVMRLSRNRNWGHPAMVSFLERFARKVKEQGIWPGLLVGDMAQPRGGPMITGHASHQLGLDADVWLSPMPDHRLSRAERENLSATNVVRADWLDVDPKRWTRAHLELLRAAAKEAEVERIFVNPAIKKAICREATGDRSWLAKLRPTWGHNYHFHIRLSCPPGESECRRQDPVPVGDGCDATLDWWFTDEALHPKPGPEKPPLKLADLPASCRDVLGTP